MRLLFLEGPFRVPNLTLENTFSPEALAEPDSLFACGHVPQGEGQAQFLQAVQAFVAGLA